jgi:hypothetical protein
MTTMIDAPEITGPQRKFLDSLVKERDWTLADILTVRIAKIVSRSTTGKPLISFVSKKDASHTIDKLLKSPKIAPILIPGSKTLNAKDKALATIADIPGAYKGVKFAIKNTDDKSPNIWVFYEVKEWKGNKYLNRLLGAPGGWNRQFVKYADYAGVAQRIKDSTYTTNEDEHLTGAMAAAARFSDTYGICACCGAKLSNGKSIAQKFGPVCAKKFS